MRRLILIATSVSCWLAWNCLRAKEDSDNVRFLLLGPVDLSVLHIATVQHVDDEDVEKLLIERHVVAD